MQEYTSWRGSGIQDLGGAVFWPVGALGTPGGRICSPAPGQGNSSPLGGGAVGGGGVLPVGRAGVDGIGGQGTGWPVTAS